MSWSHGLYLRDVSSGDFQEALSALVGEQAKGLSANTASRLKAQWLARKRGQVHLQEREKEVRYISRYPLMT